MKKTWQKSFKLLKLDGASDFGGDLLLNSHAKLQRPISIRRSMHVCLRATICRGHLSFLRTNHRKAVSCILKNQAALHRIKLHKMAIASNHIHLILRPLSRKTLISFLRSISGLIARAVLKSERGKLSGRLPRSSSNRSPSLAKKRFWDKRPWSRIINWGRDFRTAIKYLEQNTLEALGLIPYRSREMSRCSLRTLNSG